MPFDDFDCPALGNGKVVASKVYNKVISKIRALWKQVFNEEMIVSGSTPTERFDNVFGQLESALRSDEGQIRQRMSVIMDLRNDEAVSAQGIFKQFAEVVDVQRITDVSDLTPNQIKQAIYEIAWEHSEDESEVDVDMPKFLKETLRRVFATVSLAGRLNVGANRHFPRLLQWLRECEEETDLGAGRKGIRILNAGHAGRVAMNPTDPNTLLVRINGAYL